MRVPIAVPSHVPAAMQFRLSAAVSVTVSYIWRRKNTRLLWYKRAVPGPLITQVGSKYIQRSLGTDNPLEAAKLAQQITAELDRQWAALRGSSRSDTITQGRHLLESLGIAPSAPGHASDAALFALHDLLDSQLPPEFRQETTADPADLDRALPPASKAALQILQGRVQHLASDCRDEYRSATAEGAQASKSVDIPFGYLIELCGDKPLAEYRRSDVRRFVDHLVAGRHSKQGKGIATSTIDRYITAIKSAFGRSIREHELDIRNVWAGRIEYPKSAKGAQRRESFTVDDYQTLYRAIGPIDQTDDLRCILVLLAETGARLAEVVGLRTADLDLLAPVPYLSIVDHASRRLKNDYSARTVPLTDRAQQAAKRALALAGSNPYLFSRYTSAEGCKATHASNTLAKWLRSIGIDLTPHSMRHGLRSLLRDVQCLDSIANEIQGWARVGMGARYGSGSPLEVLRDWLVRATAPIMP